jgi:hypothetical protein
LIKELFLLWNLLNVPSQHHSNDQKSKLDTFSVHTHRAVSHFDCTSVRNTVSDLTTDACATRYASSSGLLISKMLIWTSCQ